MTEHPEFTVYDPASDTAYVPFVSGDGRVGYRVVDTRKGGGRETFLYFNPSGTGEEPDDARSANVFVYIGDANDPAEDEPFHYYEPWEGIPRDDALVTRPPTFLPPEDELPGKDV